jgi:hypothetical protein
VGRVRRHRRNRRSHSADHRESATCRAIAHARNSRTSSQLGAYSVQPAGLSRERMDVRHQASDYG